MENFIKTVLIGVQARSTSERLPRKAFEYIGNKRMLDHVLDSCFRAQKYSNKYTDKKNYTVKVALLCPYGDPIVEAFKTQCEIIEGPEFDVLERYETAAQKIQADFICRITGDCPLIPPYIISKHISIAVQGEYDYLSNVDEACRLSLDGIDCEVMSNRMLRWLGLESKSSLEREHVTIRARTNPPQWARRGFTASFFNQKGIKLSVDTKEDLERVRDEYLQVGEALREAHRKYDYDCIHRF